MDRPYSPLEEEQSNAAWWFTFKLTMSLLTLSLIVVVGVVWARQNPSTEAERHAFRMAQAEAFYATSCGSCHGMQGQGRRLLDAPPLDSTGQAWQYSDAEIIELMKNGGEKMPGLQVEPSDQELEAVVLYIKQWWTPEQLANQPVDQPATE